MVHVPKQTNQRQADLSELEARFAKFRREHPRHARVPFELRQAAMAALDAGILPYTLQRLCGVSGSQLKSWRASAEGTPSVRVLSVVDEPREPAPNSALELRVGPWMVSVRLADLEGERP